MPKGPQGEKRPADVIGAAVIVGRIATGEVVESTSNKDLAAVSLGRRGGLRGGKARAAKMTREKRVEIAKKAAKTRWSKAPIR